MHAVLAERARKQPENTPATRHFAKHNTCTHTYAQTHTEISLCGHRAVLRWHQRWQEDILPGSASQFSERDTNTSQGAAANTDTGYLYSLGHTDGTHSLSLALCAVSLLRTVGDNIIHQMIVQTDLVCFIVQH